jgi:cysteine desulfurase / selenocysteine lyase
VRTGHHCCQPVMDRFGIAATTRVSLAFYNTKDDVDAAIAALTKVIAESKIRASQRSAAPAPQEVSYPKAAAPSPLAAADELASYFEMFDQSDDKNRFIMDLGAKLPRTFDLLKKVTERIPGCMSEVYLVGRPSTEERDRLEFVADSDPNSEIVRGLIVLLQRIYSGQKARDVLSFDIEGFFRRIGLDSFLSSKRRTGLGGMIQRIRALANEVLA